MSEDKEKYSGDLYGYEVMLRVLDEETWVVDVRDNETDEYVDGYEFENYDEAVTEYTDQVKYLKPKTCITCGLELRGHDREGDYCLTCLQALTPHVSFDGGYYSPQALIKMGKIKQTQNDNPKKKDKES